MRKHRVLLDVDNVLGDFHQAAADAMTRILGRAVPQADLTEWDVTEYVRDPAEKRRVWRELLGRGFCSRIPVMAGAKEGVATLREMAEVYFVTSPFTGSHTWAHERSEWLKAHFGAGPEHVASLRSKFLVSGDVLVDDRPDNVRGWAEHHPSGHALLWDRHYNRGEPLRRVTSWDEVAGLVRSL